MPRLRVEVTQSAERELLRLPPEARARLVEAIDDLAEGRRADVKKLRGTKATYRLRAGEYRGIYERVGEKAIFTRFAHRSRVYDP